MKKKYAKKLNQKGSAIIQSMLVAVMVVTLSGSLSTLNIGRAKANSQMLRKAAAMNMAQIISMHMGDSQLCDLSVDTAGLPAITYANHGTNGIDVRVWVNYPAWATGAGVAPHPSGSGTAKLLPAASGVPEDSQFGDSTIYVKSIRFKLPLDGAAFDRNNIETYTLPGTPGPPPTFRNIVRYRGQLIIELGDNSSYPAPLAPTVISDFIINVDETINPPVFESCSADLGLEHYCRYRMGCNWLTNDAVTNAPLETPYCHCLRPDVAECTGPNEFISDIDPATGARMCETFFFDCSAPEAVPLSAPNRDQICFGTPEKCYGVFLSGFFDNQPICTRGGSVIEMPIDCPPQVLTWVVGSNVCQANLPPKAAVVPPTGAFNTETGIILTDNSTAGTPDPVGTATFSCVQGQMIPTATTCTSPTYNWYVGPWEGVCGGGPVRTCGPVNCTTGTCRTGTHIWADIITLPGRSCTILGGPTFGPAPGTSTGNCIAGMDMSAGQSCRDGSTRTNDFTDTLCHYQDWRYCAAPVPPPSPPSSTCTVLHPIGYDVGSLHCIEVGNPLPSSTLSEGEIGIYSFGYCSTANSVCHGTISLRCNADGSLTEVNAFCALGPMP